MPHDFDQLDSPRSRRSPRPVAIAVVVVALLVVAGALFAGRRHEDEHTLVSVPSLPSTSGPGNAAWDELETVLDAYASSPYGGRAVRKLAIVGGTRLTFTYADSEDHSAAVNWDFEAKRFVKDPIVTVSDDAASFTLGDVDPGQLAQDADYVADREHSDARPNSYVESDGHGGIRFVFQTSNGHYWRATGNSPPARE